MYLKLSFRNAKRSFTDYLLYIAAMMTLMSVMEISQCIAISTMAAGFQSSSLPIIISIIQIILISYIDRFMLKQRAKEFASYLLLGMEKGRLTALFLLEIFLIGTFCFAAGTTLGFAAYSIFHSVIFSSMVKPSLFFYGQSLIPCLFCFLIMESVCAFPIKRHFDKLTLRDLMVEQNNSQKTPFYPLAANKHFQNSNPYLAAFLTSFSLFTAFILGIAFMPPKYASALVSVLVIPLFLSVFTFYKCLFHSLYLLRKRSPSGLYKGSRLYLIARQTQSFRTNPWIDTIFCICLLFAFMAFLTGTLMLRKEIRIFDQNTQLWMGSAQLCLCILFLVLYFFLLSLQQAMNQKRSITDFSILYFIGKTPKQLQWLLNRQLCIGLALPMLAAIPILLLSIPFLNWKWNLIFPEALHDGILKSSGYFFLCILFFYFCFYEILKILLKKSHA